MKQFFTLPLIVLFATSLRAQTTGVSTQEAEAAPANLVKVNLSSFVLNNYSFQYERAIGKKISVAGGFRSMPKSGLPMKSQIENLVDDEETWNDIKDLKTSNFAITPEIRFYLGKSVFRGFYIAPFARISSYKAELPDFKFDVEYTQPDNSTTTQTETIPLSGKISTITGGLLFGAQWKLSKVLYLDWWIIGPQYGHANGDISGTKTLNQEEQQALRDELEDIDIPLAKTETTVNSNGARLDIKGPWAGLRGMGINLGFRF